MLITFHCNNCQAKLEIDASSSGTRVECPECREQVVVPRKGLEEGTTVGGFRIVRLLGRGGMGEVYLARQMSMDRLVALKILPPGLAVRGDLAERFVQEIRLTARLEHPNLVTAYDAGEDSGVLFMAMAYIQGPSLHGLVRKRGALTERESLLIGRKIASALAYAWNEHRLLHRDVKPSNVLIDPKGEPHLADLGLAKCLQDRGEGLTVSGGVIGTPNYMSPEQAAGLSSIDFHADMYSLGATLYTAVTGRIPYEARTMVETLRKQVTEPLPDPRSFAPEVSEGGVTLLGSLLAREPKQRPRTWEAAIERMDRLLAGPAGTGVPDETPILFPTAAREMPPPSSRDALVLWLGGAAVAVLAGTAVWLISQMGSREPEVEPLTEPTGAVTAPGVTGGLPSATSVTDVPPSRLVQPALPDAAGADAASEAGRMFLNAREYAREHPEDFEGTRERFRRVLDAVPDSPLAERSREFLDRSRDYRRRREGEIMDFMRRNTREAIERGDFDNALRRLQAPPPRGPVSPEMESLRKELLAEVVEARDRKQSGAVQAAVDAIYREAASELARGQVAAARRRLEEARSRADLSPAAEDLATAVALLDRAGEIARGLWQSFEAEKGRTANVEFAGGRTEALQIVGAGPDGIRARRQLPEGFVERRFTLEELSPGEKLRRLADHEDAAAALARALYALDAADRARAAQEFSRIGGPLGAALTASVSGPRGDE